MKIFFYLLLSYCLVISQPEVHHFWTKNLYIGAKES